MAESVPSSREAPRIELKQDVHVGSWVGALFLARVADDDLRYVHQETWRTTAEEPELGEPVKRESGEGRATSLYELDGTLVLFTYFAGHVYAALAANGRRSIDGALGRLHELLPPPDPSSKHEVPVTFWTYGPQGPQPSWRSIAVPGWDEIEANYRVGTRGDLEAIMRGFRPAHGGQLVLWHGPAGTGKTFALRALAWEWRDWCEFNYIVDPDAFFGQHADYLMSGAAQRERRHGHVCTECTSERWRTHSAAGSSTSKGRSRGRRGTRSSVAIARSRGCGRADPGRRTRGRRAGTLTLSQCGRRPDRSRPAGARARRPTRRSASSTRQSHGRDGVPPISSSARSRPRKRPRGSTRTGSTKSREAPTSLAALYARVEGRDPDATVLVGFGDA